jgi:hypothetical protein
MKNLKRSVPSILRQLPYGVWRCADGREVLFNRDYQPFLQRLAGVVSDAQLERVSFVDQRWFYRDSDLRHPILLRRRLMDVLSAFQRGDDVSVSYS